MELNKKDFILVTAINGQKVLGLRPDYFTGRAPIGEPLGIIGAAVGEVISEVFETKEAKEIVIIPNPEPTAEELAEIEKEKKRAELTAALKALE